MEQNERKNQAAPIFVEPEMVEDIPLSRFQRLRENAQNIRRRVRLPKLSVLLTAAAVILVLLALIAAPVIPGIALIYLLARSFRPAFRARTA